MCAMGAILFLGGWLPPFDIYPINLVPAPIWMILKILFLGGWLPPIDIYPLNLIPGPFWMVFKILLLFFLFALVKAIVPRYRYDQLMRLGWKIFLPFSLFYVVLTASFLFYFDLLPTRSF
jgi:NADH:ubiquinone oxidoreductase subunit H